MAWLTTYDDTNKVTDESSERIEQVSVSVGAFVIAYERTVTEEKYRYVAMDKASAESARTALLAAAPGGTTRQCAVRRNGPGNGYDVEVYDIVYGAWAAV